AFRCHDSRAQRTAHLCRCRQDPQGGHRTERRCRMKCAIRWIDSHGNPTPDDNVAIGYVYREAYRLIVPDAVRGYIDYERTEDFPICSEHAKRLAETDMHRWHFVPLTSFPAPSGHVYSRVAWTGGDTPTSEVRRNADYRYLRRMFFREQVRECGGLDL